MKEKSSGALAVFFRIPEWGKGKTRLAASCGKDLAHEIHQRLIAHTFHILANVSQEVYYFSAENSSGAAMRFPVPAEKWLQQEGGDLGDRMDHAFRYLRGQGYEKKVLIGSDCAEMHAGYIQEAFRQLEETSLVVGPSLDGGYCLLGMNGYWPELLTNKPWSKSHLLKETLFTAQSLQLEYRLLPMLRDVDYWEDVPLAWRKDFGNNFSPEKQGT